MKNKVKQRRDDLGLTVRDLSSNSGVSLGTISEVENEKVDPKVSNALKIAKALKSTVEELFNVQTNDYRK